MSIQIQIVVLCLFLGLSGITNSNPVAWGGKWFTLSSAHFDIHYSKELEAKARQALDIAESVHQDLTPFFSYEPKYKTQITLVDDFDFSNGWATPVPFSQIRLFASPPSSINGLENYSSWLYMLIRHEYVHILHFNLVSGLPKGAQSVLGRHFFLFPHLFLPSMFSEGLAVYLESLPEGSGRLSGNYYPMLMGSQVSHRHILDLSQVVIDSPYFNNSEAYLYGAYFVTFLAQTYGEAKLKRFLHDYSDTSIPYLFLNSSAKSVYGKDFLGLWADYKYWLTHRFEQQQANFMKKANKAEIISRSNISILATADTQQLYFSSKNGVDQPKLKRYENMESIASAHHLVAVDAHKNYGIAAIKTHVYPSGEVLNDLYLLEGSSWKRLTNKRRVSHFKWLHQHKALIFSSKRHGQSELWRYEFNGQPPKRIWQAQENQVVGDFSISPDDTTLVMALNTEAEGWNLARLNLEDKSISPVTQSRWTENSPFFIDNQRLLFSADYDGRYQIYELNLNSGEIIQRSLEAEGAFKPIYLPNQGLFYNAYHKTGYALKKLNQLNEYAKKSVSQIQSRKFMPSANVQISQKSEPKAYSVWPYIFPQQWFPIFNQTQAASQWGISTYGNDALSQHVYSLRYLYDIKNRLHSGSFGYLYDTRWFFSFSQTHNLLALPKGFGLKTHTAIENRDVLLERKHLLDLFDDTLELRAGIKSSTTTLLEPKYFKAGTDTYYAEQLAGLALVIKNQEGYRYLPYVGRGLYWDFVIQTHDVLESDFSGNRYHSKFKYSFDLPKSYQLELGLSAGHIESNRQVFALGGTKTGGGSVFLRSSPSLPGYPYGVSVGQNYAKASLSLNNVLLHINRNLTLYPVGLGDIYSRAYLNTGATWSKQEPTWLMGVGLSLNAQLKLGYRLTLPVGLGVAQGLDKTLGETQFYFRLSTNF